MTNILCYGKAVNWVKYELIGNNNIHDVVKTMLNNRGVTDVNKYINLNDNVIEDYNMLDNIQEAVRCFSEHIERGCAVGILVDTDP